MAPLEKAKSWWSQMPRRLKGWTLMAGAFTATYGVIVGFGPAYTALGLPIPASKEAVAKVERRMERKITGTETRLIGVHIDTLNIDRRLIEQRIVEIERDLRTNLSVNIRTSMELQKRSLEEDRRTIDYRLSNLHREHSAR